MAQPSPQATARIGRLSPQALAFARRILLPLVRLLWRPTLTGLEHLPTGPFLLVANHSAGIGLAELLCFAALYVHQAGPDRPLAGFALARGFALWPLSRLHPHVGTIPSTYEAAADAIGQGVPILVFPGGDHESLQPIWTPNRVDFCGRVGFLRIAHQHQLPLVPLGIRGGAWTAPIVLRARWLATALVVPRWVLGVKRWGISVLALGGTAAIWALPWPWPIRVALALLWMGSPLTFLPWLPATLRLRIGPALPPPGADLLAELAKVERAVQGLVDAAATAR